MLQVSLIGTTPVWYTMILQFIVATWPVAIVWIISKTVAYIWEIERGIR